MPTTQPSRLQATVVRVALTLIYGGVLVVAEMLRRVRHVRRPSGRTHGGRGRRLIVTGTFYHEGWYRSHLVPLSQAGFDEVVVVADAPCAPIPHVRYVCPPVWARRLMGRALAKLVWMIGAGLWHPADLFMGFHIFPGALTALVAGSVLGKPACYQSTGGPIEVIGGGANNENWFMSRLSSESVYLESLALRVVRQFAYVVVRGERASEFFRSHGLEGRVFTIPGSVDSARFAGRDVRTFDIAFVGRLTEIKQPWQFVEVVAAVRHEIPTLQAAVVGDGPLMPSLKARAVELGVSANIEWLGKRDDVASVLSRAKIFVLTSHSEGLSIAMAEAMHAGCAPVVADVGELRDLVVNGATGWLIPPDDIQAYARRIVALLRDEPTWRRLSGAARSRAHKMTAVASVAQRWRDCLGGVTRVLATA